MKTEGELVYDQVKSKFESIDVIVSVFSMQVVWASDKFSDIIGYSVEELINKHITKVLHVDLQVLLRDIVRTISGSKKVDKKNLISRNGDEIPVSCNIHSSFYDQEPYIVVCDLKRYTQPDKSKK